MIYFFYIIITILLATYAFLFLLERSIFKLERKINLLFKQRVDLIPSLYELSKDKLNKHDEIFHEILSLRKQVFSNNNLEKKLYETIKTQELVHNELNFLFKVCNKHPKLLNEGNFVYLRELVIDKSYEISQNIEKYKKITDKFNALIKIKNYSIIGLIVPIGSIDNI